MSLQKIWEIISIKKKHHNLIVGTIWRTFWKIRKIFIQNKQNPTDPLLTSRSKFFLWKLSWIWRIILQKISAESFCKFAVKFFVLNVKEIVCWGFFSLQNWFQVSVAGQWKLVYAFLKSAQKMFTGIRCDKISSLFRLCPPPA